MRIVFPRGGIEQSNSRVMPRLNGNSTQLPLLSSAKLDSSKSSNDFRVGKNAGVLFCGLKRCGKARVKGGTHSCTGERRTRASSAGSGPLLTRGRLFLSFSDESFRAETAGGAPRALAFVIRVRACLLPLPRRSSLHFYRLCRWTLELSQFECVPRGLRTSLRRLMDDAAVIRGRSFSFEIEPQELIGFPLSFLSVPFIANHTE